MSEGDEEMSELDKTLLGNFDANVWAEEFVRLVKKKPSIAIDEGCMLGWFANAMMVGYDEAKRNEPKCRVLTVAMLRLKETLRRTKIRIKTINKPRVKVEVLRSVKYE